jgi:LPXTG-site transpeptidase (sortase) family protein
LNIVVILVIAVLVSFCITYGFYYFSNKQIEDKIQDNLDEHTVYVTDSDTDLIDEDEDDVEPIEVLTADQEYKKVKSYNRVLSIPSMKINAYIYDGVGHDALTYGVGRYTNSADIGESGNMVIAGHSSDIYNCILNGIHDIETWSKIYIYDDDGNKHTYYVIGTQVVEPTDFSIFNQITDEYNQLTLFTCTNKGTQRFVIYALEMSKSEMNSFRKVYDGDKFQRMLNINEAFYTEPILEEINLLSSSEKED